MEKKQEKQQKLTKFLTFFRDYIFYNFLGGPHVLQLRYIINFFKGFTMFWIIFLMFYFRTYTTGMWVYLFLHGTYGFAWLWKDINFPDSTFKNKGTPGSLFLLCILLILYWFIPVPLATGYGIHNPPLIRIILVVMMYLMGLFLMMGSDYQKNITLARKKGLISTKFFKLTRNPNYLGQILIYGSFVICSGNIFSYLTFCVSCFLFSINIYLKEKLSYEKKQGWNEYKKQSYILLPKIFGSIILNIVAYSIIVIVIVNIALMGNVQNNLGQALETNV